VAERYRYDLIEEIILQAGDASVDIATLIEKAADTLPHRRFIIFSRLFRCDT
jgi:hypothetical protein